MQLNSIVRFLEELVPLACQESYDNSGLQVGDPEMEITGVLVTLDLTEEVVAEALDKKCNLIIAHHPVIFHEIKSLTGKDAVEKILLNAITKRIAIYAIHTNLDNYRYGLNAFVAEKLGLKELTLLRPQTGNLSKLVTFCPADYAAHVRNALFSAGAGHIGNYDCCSFNAEGQGTFRASEGAHPFVGEINELHFEKEVRVEVIFPSYLSGPIVRSLLKSHPYEEVAYDIYPLANKNPLAGSGITGCLESSMEEREFLYRVRNFFGIPVVRHSPYTGKPVRKVGLCTGSGTFLIPDAIQSECDVFLTADIRYHDFFKPEDKLLLADIGHFESEQFVKEWISSSIIEKFPTFAILISEIFTNPVKYF